MNYRIKKFLFGILKVLCSDLGADEETIVCGFNENVYKKCMTYKKVISHPQLKSKIYVFLNNKKKYNKYHDVVLCKAVDVFCEFVYAFLFYNKNDKSILFYDTTLHKEMNFNEIARKIRSQVQERILTSFSSALGLELDNLISLSEMLYESDTTKGSIAFYVNEMTLVESDSAGQCGVDEYLDNKIVVKFSRNDMVEFSVEKLGYIRKLLAGAGDENTLLFVGGKDGYKCYGYISSDYPLSCTVRFEQGGALLFKYHLTNLFRIKDRKIFCLQDRLSIYINELKSELGLWKDTDIEKIIRKIYEQTHGTSIIFMDMSNTTCSARMESLVDCCRAVRVDKVNETIWNDSKNKSMSELTRIDGATVVDISDSGSFKRIPYINVIVDGLSILPGDYSTGARHNSLICFIDSLVCDQNVKVAALVFSESGTVKLIKGSKRREKICYQQSQQTKALCGS